MPERGESWDDGSDWLTAVAVIVLGDQADDIVAEVAAQVHDGQENGSAVADFVLESEGFAASVSGIVELLRTRLVGGTGGDGRDGARVARTVAGLVKAGASTELARATVHAAVAAASDRVVGAWESNPGRGPAHELTGALRVVGDCEFELLRTFDTEVAEAFVEEENRERVRHAFLRAVLEGPVRDVVGVSRRSAALHLDLTPPVEVLWVMDAEDGAGEVAAFDGPFEDRIGRLRHRLRVPALPPVFMEPDPAAPLSAVLLVPSRGVGPADRAGVSLEGICAELGLVAARGTASEVTLLPVIFHRLRQTAPILPRCLRWLGPAPTLDSMFPYRLVEALTSSEAEDVLRRSIGPLRASANGADARTETWKLFIRERPTLAEAAASLSVAESTVRQRKAAIEKLLGHELRSGLFRSLAASYLFELWEDDLPPAGDPWWQQATPPELGP